MKKLEEYVVSIPDYPEKGIIFRDVTSILEDPEGLQLSIKPGDKVVIVDDLMATGGTAEAMIKLIEGLGGEVVEVLCLIELMGLKGREKLKGYKVDSVIQYPGN